LSAPTDRVKDGLEKERDGCIRCAAFFRSTVSVALGSRIVPTMALNLRILVIANGFTIAFGSFARGRCLALRIACEAAVCTAIII
jgi:hypothetical protein